MAARPVDSPYAWFRLGLSLLLSTIGGVGMWSVVVALPAVQAEFGGARGGASLPFTLTMLGFGVGSVLMGRLADTAGIIVPVLGCFCSSKPCWNRLAPRGIIRTIGALTRVISMRMHNNRASATRR